MKQHAIYDDKKDTSDDDNANRMSTNSSTVHFVRMFYRSWTWLFQSHGSDTVQINLGWWAQWKLVPCKLEKKRLKIAPEPLSEIRSPAKRSPSPPLPPADLTKKIHIGLLLQMQNQRKQSLLTFISHEMMMQVMPRPQDMQFTLSGSPFCENVTQIPDRTLPEPGFWKSPGEVLL